MAVTWQRYAAGVLVTGIVITGAMFWERGAALRGEDVARMNAEIWKRVMWSRLQGDQCPTNIPDGTPLQDINVGHPLRWETVYGDPGDKAYALRTALWHGMSGIRAVALDEQGPLWLDANKPLPKHGDVIADCTPFYYVSSSSTVANAYGDGTHAEVTYKLASSNHADVLRCACTRSGVFPHWPGVAATNAPLCRKWYGKEDAAVKDEENGEGGEGGDSGEWWWAMGNGATNYKYSCEAWPCVVLDLVHSGPCRLEQTRLPITQSNETATVEIELPEVNSYPRATVWKTRHLEGETGNGDEQHIAIWTGAATPVQEIYTSTPVYTLEEGRYTRLEFYTRTHPNSLPEGVTNRIEFDIVYSSGNFHIAPYPNHPLWFKQYKGHPRGDTRMLWVTCSNDVDTADSLLVWRVGYLGETYEFVIFSPDTKPGKTHDISVSPAVSQFWKNKNSDTDYEVEVSLGHSIKTWPPNTGRTTTKRNFEQAYNALTNLTRSMMFFTPSALRFNPTNSFFCSAYAYSASNTVPDLADEVLNTWEDAFNNVSTGRLDRPFTFVGEAPYVCATWADGSYNYEMWDGKETQSWSCSASTEWYELAECHLPWPARAAYETGAVSRVEVFAVFSPHLNDNIVPRHYYDRPYPYYDEEYSTITEYNAFYTGTHPSTSEGLLPWGCFPKIEQHHRSSSSKSGVTVSTASLTERHLPLRLTSVAVSADAPTSSFVFDINFRPVSLALAGARENRWEFTHEHNVFGDTFESANSCRDIEAVGIAYLKGWVVVVDWNWDF